MIEDQIQKRKKRKSTTIYPKNSLKEALKIPKSILENNAGESFNRILLAQSLDLSPNGVKIRTLITSSRNFGLTSGGYNAEEIELTDLGRSIIKLKSDEERNKALLNALFNVPFYKEFFTKYNNQSLPNDELLKKILCNNFNVPIDATENCIELILENAKYLDIIQETKGKRYILLSNLKTKLETESELQKEDDKNSNSNTEEEEKFEAKDLEILENIEQGLTEKKPIVFISHSKNLKILNQIKQVLEFGQFEYKIAEEIETTAIPIPEKVFSLMRQCNSAIINMSADEQEKQNDGSYKINQNVLIEIGSCFLAYNKKVILLVDKRIELPSNLQGLYRCEYEGDELSWDAGMKLQDALKKFREPNF